VKLSLTEQIMKRKLAAKAAAKRGAGRRDDGQQDR
jgi:hypothetical protein